LLQGWAKISWDASEFIIAGAVMSISSMKTGHGLKK